MIVDRLDDYMASQRKITPQHTNRASNLGHPCLRYLIYCRTNWKDTTLIPISLQYLFDGGRAEERDAVRLIHEAGIEIIEQQKSFEWKEYQITGHLDWKTLNNGTYWPTEFKGLSPYSFDSIENIDDMRHHKYLYVRGYLAQLTLYMLMDNKEQGLFLFRNKATKRFKEIPFNLDYDLGEHLIQKAEKINSHIKVNSLPDRMNNAEICSECQFAHICTPDLISNNELSIVNDKELLDLLQEKEKIQEFFRRYNEIQSQLKTKLKGITKTLVGDWLIDGKLVKRNGYTVEASEYWQPSISKIIK